MGPEQPPFLKVVTPENSIKPNIKETLDRTMPESLIDIEAMRYSEAFARLTEALSGLERTLGKKILEESVQKEARKALAQLWKSFIEDTTNNKKLRVRLNAMREKTDEAVTSVTEKRASAERKFEQLPNDSKKYLEALIEQRAQETTKKVVLFPNQDSQKSHFDRQFDQMVETTERPIHDAYEPELIYIEFIGTLYNTVLPMLRKLMEGYVQPMIKGKRNYSNYLPVTAETVTTNISDFLKISEGMAKTLSELSLQRDKANYNVPKK